MKKLYSQELKLAKRLAVEAGQKLLALQKKHNKIIKQPNDEGYLDVTTEADLLAEKVVLGGLTKAFPADYILSEETRTSYSSKWSRVWIVDPLDGTTNYVKGFAAYAVSIALVVEGKVVLGVCFFPLTEDLFYAVRGQGVYKNNRRLSVMRPAENLAQSLVSIGFPHVRQGAVADQAFILYRKLWLASSDLRRSASAVFDGCLLCQGITGAYLTPDIKPWDIAACSLFVEEQGGVVSDFSGKSLDLFRRVGERFSTSVVMAKNREILEALQRVI